MRSLVVALVGVVLWVSGAAAQEDQPSREWSDEKIAAVVNRVIQPSPAR